MSMIVYKITNKINGKSYIGQTTESLSKRWARHCRSGSHCTALKNAIKKYGKENFKIEIIFKTNLVDELNKNESHFINYFNSLVPNGYNMNTGGFNPMAVPETRAKLSAINSGSNHPMFGKHHSKESKLKISIALSKENHPQFGRPCSEETKAKISSANKGKKKSKEFSDKKKKSIICLQTGKIYSSISDAAKELSVSITAISNVLVGKSKTSKGLTFIYKKE